MNHKISQVVNGRTHADINYVTPPYYILIILMREQTECLGCLRNEDIWERVSRKFRWWWYRKSTWENLKNNKVWKSALAFNVS